MEYLAGKRILIGVTGGIAAYKAAELVRLLRKRGAEVRVILTQSASEFVSPLTLQTLSGHPVHRHLIDEQAELAMGHIELARWMDAILIAPASANTIARLAQGRAEDLLSAVCLAADKPRLFAPAMNRQMWDNAVTRRNVNTLEEAGWIRLGPAHGEQACGEIGEGRMMEPEHLTTELAARFATGTLAGVKVVVTAGPTWEAIDPVRGLSNKSSGKMGYAIAVAAREAGANVTLVSGPVALAAPEGLHTILVESAEEMLRQASEQCREAQIFISAAAVADYRPVRQFRHKPSKHELGTAIELEQTPDVVATIAGLNPELYCVGFAAESDQLLEKARHKLKAKQLDLIAANRIDLPNQGLNVDDNAIVLIDDKFEKELPLQSKTQLARELIREIAERYHAKNTTQDPRQANRQ